MIPYQIIIAVPGPDLMGLSLQGHEPPALLKKGIITIAEAEKLFNMLVV